MGFSFMKIECYMLYKEVLIMLVFGADWKFASLELERSFSIKYICVIMSLSNR